MISTHDPLRAGQDIREQLALEKRRLAFFFGAGTSMAVGLPGIMELTAQVSQRLEETAKSHFGKVMDDLAQGSNVEHVLDRVRMYRELIGESEEKEFAGIKGATAARALDYAICQAIREIIRVDPPKGMKPHQTFGQWLRALHIRREWPVEVFSTNYDLLFERAFEDLAVPFFDGFVGSVTPFFAPESVEAEDAKTDAVSYPPRGWTRLWKMHGSINWRVQRNKAGGRERITRLPDSQVKEDEELLIFPSRDKYTQSRKLPFLTFQDRFRRFVSAGERLLVVLGYRFSDEHLNEIMFQGLRSNPRLAVAAFMHSTITEEMEQFGRDHRNLTFYGPDKACIGGIVAPWNQPPDPPEGSQPWPFWDTSPDRFNLGDFDSFSVFLEEFIGFK